jgi:F0F1-type ATP synthase assembly protein I
MSTMPSLAPRVVQENPGIENSSRLLHELPRAAHVGGEARMKKSPMALAGEYMSLAFLIPVSTFVGYAIGYLLDKAFDTHFLYKIFLILGIVSGFVQLIRKVMRDNADESR